MLGIDDHTWDNLFKPYTHHDSASLLVTLARPKSRGTIRLRSSDPFDDPIIDPNYYRDPQDVRVMLEGNCLTCVR